MARQPAFEELDLGLDLDLEEEEEFSLEDSEQQERRTRKGHIRELFQSGLTRSEIAKEMGLKYQTVYTATKGLSVPKAQGKRHIMESGELRGDYIRRRVSEGQSRSEIAKELGVTYQVVYAATKGLSVPAGRRSGHTMENGEPRRDYIRRRISEGQTRGEIARELGVTYQVVYAATKDLSVPEAKAAEVDAE